MLKLTSRFVLQVLPYLLMALAAVVLLPGVADSLLGAALPAAVSSHPHAMEMTIEPFGRGETTLIHQDHEVFAPNRFLPETAKAAQADLEDR
ncbi:MAG TPA: hypothetical protein VHT68_17095 [Pseudolabrys sp.]|jgi:hypothetical protein|nr:hypothetical protein [Pseudolabrys sp.]